MNRTPPNHDPATPRDPDTRAAGVVVFLIDESTALEARVAGGTKSKAESIATALNSLLNQLASGPAVQIALVGYRAGPDGQADVGVRWAGPLAGQKLVSSPQLPATPLAVESRTRKVPAAGGVGIMREEQVQFPVWYRPALGGALPPARALEGCLPLLEEWVQSAGPWARPPLLVHLIGELSFQGPAESKNQSYATDVLERLRQLTTPAGPPLLFHAHLTSSVRIPATLYPSSGLHLPPGGPQELFQASSVVPAPLAAALAASQVTVHSGARGLIFNGQLTDLIRFFSLVKAYAAWQPPQPAADVQAAIPSSGGETSVAFRSAKERSFRGAKGDNATVIDALGPSSGEETSVGSDAGRIANPSGSAVQTPLLVLLLDRSSQRPGEPGAKNVWSRIQQQANELLAQIAKRAEAAIDVALLAYGGETSGPTSVAPAWAGPLAGRPWVRGTELAAGPLRIDEADEQVSNGIGGLVSVHRKRPVYVELEPMPSADPAPALAAVGELVDRWRRESSSAGPVLVLHLTRGCQPPDFKPRADAAQAVPLPRQGTSAVGWVSRPVQDGSGDPSYMTQFAAGVILAHLVLTESPHRSLCYPGEMPAMEAPELVRLWELSSPLPPFGQLPAGRPALAPGARALVVNGKFDLLWECLSGHVI